ncbi:MAG TPA: methylenetetrahydrofolate reductase [Steroidobacteraceae bacterium]|nr:methylenetetrahydrofolate reductase [Steroidobacteraceae bacterium]
MPTLADKVAAREFVVTTELVPPKGTDLSEVFARAQLLRAHVDAFNLTESPRARMAIAPFAVARLLLERDVEPIVQVTARDRNRIAIQSDVLGAAALGVRNFVFMAGDPPTTGDHPDAKPVFDLNSNQMLRAAHALAQGRDMAGNPLRGAPNLFLGATANPGAADLEGEVTNTRRKIDAGAQFLQTQAIYERDTLERFLERVKPDGVAILAGIIPLKSARMAAWLDANLPGVRVPERLQQEMLSVSGTNAEVGRGIEIAARTISEVQALCAGVHLMTLGWEEHIPAILAASSIRS